MNINKKKESELVKEEDIYNSIVNEKKQEKQTYTYVISTSFINILTFFVVIGFTIGALTYQPPEKYILANNIGQIVEEKPLSEDIMDEAKEIQLLADQIKDIYEFHYINVDSHGSKVSNYFTEDSFASYWRDFQGSNDYSLVKSKKAIVSANVNAPIFLDKKVVELANGDKILIKQYETTVLQIYQSPIDGIFRQKHKVQFVIQRFPLTEYETGIAIRSFISEPIGG